MRGFVFAIIIIYISCANPSQEEQRPNFVLIMADDLGYQGISCFGNKEIQTPHLDKLGTYGLKLSDFHANGSVCTPTRAALLTGRYQQRAGLEGVIYARGETRHAGMDTSEYTIADALKGIGYKTGIMGKWHLGYEKQFFPTNNGFDEFYGYVSGNVDFHSHYDNTGVYDWWHNLDSINEEGYVTDLITDHSIDFIEKHKDENFFLYIPHEAPHVPFQGRNDPAYRFADNEFTYYGPVEDQERAYKEMVEVMDEGIGKVVKAIEDNGLSENTLIIFISDNGGEAFGHNGPLNNSKGSLYEGGHRVPAIFYWPGMIAPSTSDDLTMTFDIMPTILSLANAEAKNMDGVDLSDLLLNQQALPARDVFWKYRKQQVIRNQNYKLLIDDQDTLLFDLEVDLGETINLSKNNPSKKNELLARLIAWDTEISMYDQSTN